VDHRLASDLTREELYDLVWSTNCSACRRTVHDFRRGARETLSTTPSAPAASWILGSQGGGTESPGAGPSGIRSAASTAEAD